MNGVFYGGFIRKGMLKEKASLVPPMRLLSPEVFTAFICRSAFPAFDQLKVGLPNLRLRYPARHRGIQDDVGKFKEPQFFDRSFLQWRGNLLYEPSDVSEQPYVATDNRRQLFHLSHARDTRFEDTQLVLRLQLPDGKGTPTCELKLLGLRAMR